MPIESTRAAGRMVVTLALSGLLVLSRPGSVEVLEVADAPVVPAPVNVTPPVVTGIVRISQVLSSTTGVWTDAVSYSYQWYRGGVVIVGATSSTYTVLGADVRELLSCRVVATGPGGVSAPAASNSLASPWQPILAAKPSVLIFDGLDPACMGGVSIAAAVASMSTVDGISLGSQVTTGNRATRLVNGLSFNGSTTYYVFLSTVAAYFNNLTTYAVHADVLSGLTGRNFYDARSTLAPTSTRQARVANVVSTTRNDHRTQATQTILSAPAGARQDLVIRWEPANSALYNLAAGVVVHTTCTGTATPGPFDQMTLGTNQALSGFWTGTLSAWCVDNTAWDTTTMALWRSCAIAAGVM